MRTNPKIDEAKMKEVYKHASPIGHENEVIIPKGSSLEQTVAEVKRAAGI